MAAYESAPPSYGEIMGTSHNACPLAHVDIWPRCHNGQGKAKHGQFDQFEVVLQLANDWMCLHSTCEIINCETVQKKIYLTVNIYNDSTNFDAKGGTAIWIHGLRLWLRQSETSKPPPVLAYRDLVPQPVAQPAKYPIFQPVNTLVDNFNLIQRSSPLQGKIISIDTVCVSASENEKTGVHPSQTAYLDNYKKHRYIFLRIFYIVGVPCDDTIGLADFTPNQVKETGTFNPKPGFAGHHSMMQKAQQWIASTRAIKVTNMQTLDSRYWKIGEHGQRLDTLCTSDYKIEERYRILYMRIAYLRPGHQSSLLTRQLNVMCVPFIPQQKIDDDCFGGKSSYENFSSVVSRATNWVKRTGGRVLCVETCNMIEKMFWNSQNGVNSTEFSGEWYVVQTSNDSGSSTNYYMHKLLTIIRVYLEHPVREMPVQSLPVDDSCCTIV